MTLRLLVNYGGVLQNYALQTTLRKLGFEPVTVRSSLPMSLDTWELTQTKGNALKWLAVKLGMYRLLMLLGDDFCLPYRVAKWLRVKSLILASMGRKTVKFIHRHIKRSHCCGFPITESDVKRIDAWAYVVGGDQVWRYQYSKDKRPFFCHFVSQEVRRRSISYAASFGSIEWEWPERMTTVCKELAQDFRAHSVREEEGIQLCEQHLGVSAQWVPDPTLLLTKEEYRTLVKPEDKIEVEPYVGYYILDMTPQKREYIEKVASRLHCRLVDCKYDEDENGKNSFRSVESWLYTIDKAKYLVTDSYHGLIFALIFNTDFSCILNAQRGASRFISICRKLDLHHHMVDALCPSLNQMVMMDEEEWRRVNQTIALWREEGCSFLVKNLKEEAEIEP